MPARTVRGDVTVRLSPPLRAGLPPGACIQDSNGNKQTSNHHTAEGRARGAVPLSAGAQLRTGYNSSEGAPLCPWQVSSSDEAPGVGGGRGSAGFSKENLSSIPTAFPSLPYPACIQVPLFAPSLFPVCKMRDRVPTSRYCEDQTQ